LGSNLAFADEVVIVSFFAVMLGIGLYYSSRMRNIASYFSGGRRVPWWLSGVSLYMSSFSAFSFVAYSELAYKYGMVAITIWWFMVPCILISAHFFAARWRRAASTSPLEYIETRFNSALRQGLAWLGVPLLVIDDGLKLFALSVLVSVGLGLDLTAAILLSSLVILSYTFLGGLWAVLVTDCVQFVIMLASVIVLIPLTLSRVGGFSGFFTHMPEGFLSPVGGDYTWFYVFAFFVVQVFSYSTKWPYVQRYYSVRSDSDARKVGYLVALLTFIGPVIYFFPAMAAKQFLPSIENTKEVYAILCRALLPVGMMGMLIAAMFSATMSTLSGDYNAMAAVITKDIYERLFARRASQRALVLAGRLVTALVGIIAMGIGLTIAGIAGTRDLFMYIATLLSVLVPPTSIPMMFGLVSKKISAAGGFAGFVAGSAAGIVAFVLSLIGSSESARQVTGMAGSLRWAAKLSDVRYMTWVTTIPTVVVMFLFTALRPATPEQRERIKRFLGGIGSKQEDHGIAAKATPETSPLPVIGVSIGIIGLVTAVAVLMTAPIRTAMITAIVGLSMSGLGAACLFWPRLKHKSSRKEVGSNNAH